MATGFVIEAKRTGRLADVAYPSCEPLQASSGQRSTPIEARRADLR